MKTKDGKLKLTKNDIQVGNFVITAEKMHYKMQDINGYWSMRVNFFYPMYTLIEECIKAKNNDYLEAIAKIMYAIGTTPPDTAMLEDLYKAYNGLIGRMKDKGMFKDNTDEENLQQTQQALEAKEQLKKVMEDEPIADTPGQPA